MKRTINDIYELLKQQKENAINDLAREKMRQYPSTKKQYQLQGSIDTYTLILTLIETSSVLTDPNAEEQLKKILWLIPITTIITSLANAKELELLDWFKNYIERSAKYDK